MSKIAVMDSGLGGLTVLSALERLLPDEDYIYYGDSANAPYGDKTAEELKELNTEVCNKLLSEDEIKCFVVACNTTTSQAFDKLEAEFPEHDFVGIEPAVQWAAEEMPGGNILVLATTATIQGEKLRTKIAGLSGKAHITALAAPGVVPYVEGGGTDTDEFMDYLRKLTADFRNDTDAVVLGCTHFPFIKKQLRECFDKDIKFYDAAVLVAEQVKKLLTEKNRLNKLSGSKDIDAAYDGGNIIFLNSDASKVDTEKRLLKQFTESECAERIKDISL